MASESMEALFGAWGRAYSEQPWKVDPAEHFRRTASHPLAQAQEFAPGKKERSALKMALHLTGRARRTRMGVSAELGGMVPRWAVDPVRCVETRVATRSDRTVHPMLARIDQAVRDIESRHLLRGLCFRLRYCLDGTDTDKVIEVNFRMRQISKGFEGIALKRYRDEVHDARIAVEAWLDGYLAQTGAGA